jgi:hypothetical protein
MRSGSITHPPTAAQTLVAARDLIPVFETALMYTGPDPAIDLSKLFDITTFELG